MNISIKPCENLECAADITFDNMRIYYEKYAPQWTVKKVLEVTETLDNYDIVYNDNVVGVMRLDFEQNHCILRDLQVLPVMQNKGIGKTLINKAKELAVEKGYASLTLRVFKISPAAKLYLRNGFLIQSEDDRFYSMLAKLT